MASCDSDDDLLAIYAVLNECRKRKRKKQPRRWWVRSWLARRPHLGAYRCLMEELRAEAVDEYTMFLRMDPHHFEFLLNAVRPMIEKENTVMRQSIPAGERLAVTLRFLASGDSFASLSYLYRISRQSLGKIIPETCDSIYTALADTYLKAPSTVNEWQQISADFRSMWEFPNCIGAIDGKHIALKAPNNSGSAFYNYKGFHSIVLLAVVDAHYRVVLYDRGVNGRHSDAGIFGSSNIPSALESEIIPPPKQLPDSEITLPHVIVGVEAFPLKLHIMKPYPSKGLSMDQRVFNYRLSHARRVSENAFGILVNRFAVLATRMCLQPKKAECVGRACLALHNFMRTERYVRYSVEIRQNAQHQWYSGLGSQSGNRNAGDARHVRNSFRDYFTTAGAVEWQWGLW